MPANGKLALETISCSINELRADEMTYLANDLRTQADYIRGCLNFGHLGYADAKMLDRIEQAAARITTQHDSLDEFKALVEEQADHIQDLSRNNVALEESNRQLRETLCLVVEELSSCLANYRPESANSNSNTSYKQFEILEVARKAIS